MTINLLNISGIEESLFGIGLSFGLTSNKKPSDIFDRPFDKNENSKLNDRLINVASKLCKKGSGEDKFLRQIIYWWDVTAPRYWWAEADTYKVATVAQSESTMHTLMHRDLIQEDFEDEVYKATLFNINQLIKIYRETKSEEAFLQVKNILPEGFLQRRVWSMSLANMKNIYHQRKSHRLPQWQTICGAFFRATPEFLRGIYDA